MKLKLRTNKYYHENGTAYWDIVTSLLLKPLEQGLIDVSSFRLSKALYYRSVQLKRINNFGSVFPYRLGRRTYETKFQAHVSSLFPLFISKPFFIITVVMLSLYQSPGNCRTRNVWSDFRHQTNYCRCLRSSEMSYVK
jgi:hypothetical protein